MENQSRPPKLTGGANKRRMPDNPSMEMLKKKKMDVPPAPLATSSIATAPSNRGSRATTVEEVEDEDTSGRDFAPGGDADYFVEEDEEGRFFGGGLTREQKDILNIFDNSGLEGVQEDVSIFAWNTYGLIVVLKTECDCPQLEISSMPGIRRVLLRFERALNKNQDQRSKHPNDPSK
jgi:beta-catenin-like protein 1